MKKNRTPFAIFPIASPLEAAGLHPDPATAPVLSQPDLLQWAIGLGLMVLLILLSGWMLRRFSGFSFAQGHSLRILGGLSVGSRERIVLLQIGEKQLLLGVAPGRVETLHVFEPGELAGAAGAKPGLSARRGFQDRIEQAIKDS